MDREAWWAMVHRVSKSQTRLKQFSTSLMGTRNTSGKDQRALRQTGPDDSETISINYKAFDDREVIQCTAQAWVRSAKCSASCSVVSDSLRAPWTEFSRPEYWNGQFFPSPGIFPTQGSNPGFLHCRQILYQMSHKVSTKDRRNS